MKITPVVALEVSFITLVDSRKDMSGTGCGYQIPSLVFRARNPRKSPRLHKWERNHDQSEALLWIHGLYYNEIFMNEFSISLPLPSRLSLAHLFFIQRRLSLMHFFIFFTTGRMQPKNIRRKQIQA